MIVFHHPIQDVPSTPLSCVSIFRQAVAQLQSQEVSKLRPREAYGFDLLWSELH